jgi:CMP-N-acetylneuraminic acid synthetase
MQHQREYLVGIKSINSQIMSLVPANPNIVALLPMKAHSQRVSGKNFKHFAGKPLFRWIVDSLMGVECIKKIVINTDAREILAQHGLVAGGKIFIRDRKDELQGDMISMNRILEDDIQAVSADLYLMTHTTNPLLSSATINCAIRSLTNCSDKDSLFSVNRVQTRFYREDASPVNHDPDNLLRTQDLEPWFEENSSLYLFTKDSFNASNARIGKKPLVFPTPLLESIDIDTQETWCLAEMVALSRSMIHSSTADTIRAT